MKIISILCISCFLGISYAQELDEIDQRLVATHGDKIITLYENNKEYYDFLLYELNNAFFIIEQSEINSLEKDNYRQINTVNDKKGQTFNLDDLNDLSSFNFFNYSFVRFQDERVTYDLGEGRFLVFYSLNELKDNYGK